MLFGHYQAYPFLYQMIGVFVVVLVFVIFLLGFEKPDLLQKLAALDEKPTINSARDNMDGVDNGYVEMPPTKGIV